MYRKTGNGFLCAVTHREKGKLHHANRISTPEGREKLRVKNLEAYHRRKNDPVYRLKRQLSDLCRVRVRY